MSEIFPKAWVLWYRYYDGSGSGVLRAYTDKVRAKQDKELFNGVNDFKEYELAEVPFFGSTPNKS